MKHILLLTDFSDNSKNAIKYALNFFNDELCTFYLLYVQSSKSYTTDDLMTNGNTTVYDSIIKKSKHKLEKLIVSLTSEFTNKNHSFQAIVDYDSLTDSIKQIIKSKKIDLIVMGTNGVTGAKEVVFGSNTINVIRHINCNTLVIPEGFNYAKKPKDILLPLDENDSLQGAKFNEVAKLIKKYKLLFHALRINPIGKPSIIENADTKTISDILKGKRFKHHIVNNIPMHYVVDCYLQTNTIDFMSLIVQKESLFERFFIGSPTTQISNKLRVPLLILHSN
ncbi:universal stress protein UspA [Aquaticitalea lipolytica]|uniref:Universal stress protein UspA n=1 Tax=Aquaticitalea lipolytica TaxID=1247562 RepID=A0A8J2TNA5_9FLAO|nr:universal stress protein [Aquaticitalea lipolytica]GFZ76121.1 universal stress protein UspA [Aquaticitalea lipolytica]